MSNEIRLASNSLTKRNVSIKIQKAKIEEMSEILFKRINDLLFNVDKSTNICHPTNHQRITQNLFKFNYRNFCFRMIKKLSIEIIEIAHQIHSQIKCKAVKPWLLHVARVMRKMIWMWSKYFYGLAILEQQDVNKSLENIQLFHKFSTYELKQYKRHLEIAANEIRNALPYCKVEMEEKEKDSLRQCMWRIPVSKYERFLEEEKKREPLAIELSIEGKKTASRAIELHATGKMQGSPAIALKCKRNEDSKICDKRCKVRKETKQLTEIDIKPKSYHKYQLRAVKMSYTHYFDDGIENQNRDCTESESDSKKDINSTPTGRKRHRTQCDSDSNSQCTPLAKRFKNAIDIIPVQPALKKQWGGLPNKEISQKFLKRSLKSRIVCKRG